MGPGYIFLGVVLLLVFVGGFVVFARSARRIGEPLDQPEGKRTYNSD